MCTRCNINDVALLVSSTCDLQGKRFVAPFRPGTELLPKARVLVPQGFAKVD